MYLCVVTEHTTYYCGVAILEYVGADSSHTPIGANEADLILVLHPINPRRPLEKTHSGVILELARPPRMPTYLVKRRAG